MKNYELKSIPLEDVDLLRYLVVKDATTYDDDKWIVFPKSMPTLDAPPMLMRFDVVVMNVKPEEFIPNPDWAPFSDEEDGWTEPAKFLCYMTPEIADGRLIWTKHTNWQGPLSYPVADNKAELRLALQMVAARLDSQDLGSNPWHERLQESIAMLDDNANELHILHNAGFYDSASLHSLLCLPGVEQQSCELMANYSIQMERYAMFALNYLNWTKGGYRNR